MAEVLRHHYLEKYPVREKDRILILGTLHPGEVENFVLPFFYGNRNTLWRFLAKAFPEELTHPDQLPSVLSFLEKRRIAVSDVIREGVRTKTRSGDGDLIPHLYNHELIKDISHSQIEAVLCMSGNHSKGSFGILFEQILQLKRPGRNIDLLEGIKVKHSEIGREVLIHALPSPSGAANASIVLSKNYQNWKKKNPQGGVVEYRVEIYRKILRKYFQS